MHTVLRAPLAVLALAAGTAAAGPSSPPRIPSPAAARHDVAIDSGWRFVASEATDPSALAALPADAWRAVSLPHTWNALDATDVVPGYHRGAGWYLRRVDVPASARVGRVLLHFGAANTVADVWVNGRHVGGHRGGYLPFDVDVHDAVRWGARNEVAVRVSNADDLELIPSRRGDFVIYGGLTRSVSLVTTPTVALSALVVRTPEVSAASGHAIVTAELRNPSGARGTREVTATLAAPGGTVLSRATAPVTLSGDSAQHVTLDLPAVAHPALWSPASPALYRLSVTLAGGGTTDALDDRVGFRSYRFDDHGAFYLNGQRLLIRGTQRHEESAGVGGAVPAAAQVADMAAIKAMGANFVRLAHYPQHPAVYRAADSLGILLWDELPWDRGGVGDSAWQATTRRLLAEQIHANGNHPSIIVWSLGNEVQDVIEPTNAGDTPALRRFLGGLREIAHTLDPARPTAMRKFDGGADLVDVYSPSIWAGWYGGVYRNYEAALTAARAKFPHLLHMEYGADAHYGRHTETPITGEGRRIDASAEEQVGKPVANIAHEGDWSESYQTDLLDWHLGVSERLDWFAGSAQWVFKDFATPLRPDNPIPYVNEKGLLTRDGRRKDAYYVFASWWTTSPSFVYILSHEWPERAGAPGQARTVRVYSNCAAVELTLNGTSQGTKPRVPADFPSQGLRWEVHFADGANALRARCSGAEGAAAQDTLTVRYTTVAAGKPADIRLATRPLPNGHLLVEATIVDAKGHPCLAAADRIFFEHDGGGMLVADQGTPTGSRVIEAANGRAAIEIVPPEHGSSAIITARTQDINGTRLTVGGR